MAKSKRNWREALRFGKTITEPLRIVILVKPVTKKNSIRWVKLRGVDDKWKSIPSAAYEQYEKDCGYFIRCKGLKISCPVNMRVSFYIDADRECDVSNFCEAVADMLVHYQVLQDDHRLIVTGWDGTRVYVDRINPRTEIIIEPIPQENEQLMLGLTSEDDF
jgi:Holliday junction resolvase RusA-like endonuclease